MVVVGSPNMRPVIASESASGGERGPVSGTCWGQACTFYTFCHHPARPDDQGI